MQLVPDWAPNIHPMIVHFPIVSLIGAVFFDLLNLFLKRYDWLNKSALALYLLGTVAIIITFFTGRSAADGLDIPAQIIPAVTDHADWAELTLWFFIIFLVVRLAARFWLKSVAGGLKNVVGILLVFISLPGIYLLYETADHGAKLVFGYGLGTGNILKSEELTTKTVNKTKVSDSTFTESENGSWRLIADEGVLEILSEKFRWIEGSLIELGAMYDESESSLMFHLKKEVPTLAGFVYDKKIKSFRITANVNVDDFNGELELVHHFKDKNNYDFLLIRDKKISLSRKVNGEIETFEEDNFSGKGWIEVKVVNDRTHFRGYVNNKLIVHGRDDESDPGSVGIKFSGTGIISIKMINVESLK